ncbi:hypothetical protein C4K35_4206 [Pseudomonas chlororaphis subsp. piscium]|nr:hypothetical protein C4K35_4206 [Pseudomonas chlororaphis subsp. piscium]
MQAISRRRASLQLIFYKLAGAVVYLFECPVPAELDTQVVIRDMVHGKGQIFRKGCLDLHISTVVSNGIMVLRQPFVQRYPVVQARNHFTNVAYKPTIKREWFPWIGSLKFCHSPEKLLKCCRYLLLYFLFHLPFPWLENGRLP